MSNEELAAKVKAAEIRILNNTERIEKLERSTNALNRLATAVEVMATKQDTMSGSLDRLTGKVEALEAEPGKRWRFVVEKAIYVVVAAIVGFCLARVGL